MKNVLLVHGVAGVLTFKDDLIQNSDATKLKFIAPSFPTIYSKAIDKRYSTWRKIFEKLGEEGIFTPDLSVVAHSLGTIGFIKYLTENNIKINTYVSVSGLLGKVNPAFKHKIIGEPLLKCLGFNLKEKDLVKASGLIENRHSFISNDDHLIEESELKRYATLLNAKTHMLENFGHFSRTKNIRHIPGLCEIINGYETKNEL